ncbi:hypothetical protein ANT_29400 [Anaerolinea thermophila UNI-1]|uniref:Uncharacterized protein n=1 Tax=Anaerolinea thermophila (strain DSM 14523 / JCM 11388 / NBRC 100420 / UNI-1) TaxID=926569 RepID=E8N219_ANATU|nr:hypothetical protein ANT_29400 [Anaerolinea thermophila UNI-1]
MDDLRAEDASPAGIILPPPQTSRAALSGRKNQTGRRSLNALPGALQGQKG